MGKEHVACEGRCGRYEVVYTVGIFEDPDSALSTVVHSMWNLHSSSKRSGVDGGYDIAWSSTIELVIRWTDLDLHKDVTMFRVESSGKSDHKDALDVVIISCLEY